MKPNAVTGGVTLENFGELRTIGLAHTDLLKRERASSSPLAEVVTAHKDALASKDAVEAMLAGCTIELNAAQTALAILSVRFALLMPSTDLGLRMACANLVEEYRLNGGFVDVLSGAYVE
jgi:hypothetical protein